MLGILKPIQATVGGSIETMIEPEIVHRIEKILQSYAEQIERLQLAEEDFQDWFGPQLFYREVNHPRDYLLEMQHNLAQLKDADSPQRELILSEQLARQLSAFEQALRHHQSR
ncbi:primosomal replication protein PriC [Pseudidiomarina taiwanensis]|uniref:Uncharacterized protein n=1 Tax=Pseudidiomarina taiwanensis TaxID=337250 RepID=A0A432ZP19_9GAMM|nr:primosomal replication protein PriC [Pseudidiomarina taiwanensis]RUO79601.1 hypothetical protein CWI83_03640 [Pseudidiomarina taiwanensis]